MSGLRVHVVALSTVSCCEQSPASSVLLMFRPLYLANHGREQAIALTTTLCLTKRQAPEPLTCSCDTKQSLDGYLAKSSSAICLACFKHSGYTSSCWISGSRGPDVIRVGLSLCDRSRRRVIAFRHPKSRWHTLIVTMPVKSRTGSMGQC